MPFSLFQMDLSTVHVVHWFGEGLPGRRQWQRVPVVKQQDICPGRQVSIDKREVILSDLQGVLQWRYRNRSLLGKLSIATPVHTPCSTEFIGKNGGGLACIHDFNLIDQ